MGSTTTAHDMVTITLTHHSDPTQFIKVKALIVSRISGQLPDRKFDSPFMHQIVDSQLADPSFNMPGPIDLLLGAGAWAMIIREPLQYSRASDAKATAQLTQFGWVIFGQIAQVTHVRLRSCHLSMESDDARLDEMLVKFWNANSIPKTRQWTPAEQLAEDVFISTHRRDKSGRYIVKVSRANDARPLGSSCKAAKACFFSIQRDPHLYSQYKAGFDDYRARQHMVLAPASPPNSELTYYLPHHPINAAVAGTRQRKFRVVFNASAPSDNGISFNDQQLAGPKMQDDLIATFMRFRTHRFAVSADVKQMFRQVNVDSSEWNYQRVFWRDSPADEL